jgi:hypothetical protein
VADFYLYLSAFWPRLWAVVSAGALLGLDPLIRSQWPWGAQQLDRVPALYRRRIEFALLIAPG